MIWFIEISMARKNEECLSYVRELKGYGVSVYFEKEKLDTESVVSEMAGIYADEGRSGISVEHRPEFLRSFIQLSMYDQSWVLLAPTSYYEKEISGGENE